MMHTSDTHRRDDALGSDDLHSDQHHDVAGENDDDSQHSAPDQASSPLTTIDDTETEYYSQKRRQTRVVIYLSDCMECHVRISRCQVKQQDRSTDAPTPTELEGIEQQQDKEEEEKKAEERLSEQIDRISSQREEENEVDDPSHL